MDTRRLPLSHIYQGEGRLRATQPERVAELARSIERLGLQTPLTVKTCTRVRDGMPADAWEIVAGHHRYEALRKLARQEADCVVWDGEAAQARLWEIAENLHRAELTVQERADHIAEWMRITGERIVASCDNSKPGPKGVLRAAARDLGISKDEASRSNAIAGITEAAREAADQAGLNTQAARLAIAKAEPDRQVAKVTELAAARSKPVPLPKNELETEDDWRNAMMRLWNRAPDEWRERFIDYVQSPVFDNTRAGVV